ncbi:MAG: copper amine oxidase N-terminal domain-containing protein, partial [Clostridium sp.]|nr:copper amine oxidase N-terminal domain-containing protein [Clostridium sp.]
GGGALPGSAEDPLVTRSWVDQYIAGQLAPLEARLEQAASQMPEVPSLKLWIGRDYLLNGEEKVSLDVKPYLGETGRTMVPLRALGEAIGAEFSWDNSTKRVVYTKGGREVVLWVGRAEVQANGQRTTTDCAPELVNGRLMVPLRVITENLGFHLIWNHEQKMASLLYLGG